MPDQASALSESPSLGAEADPHTESALQSFDRDGEGLGWFFWVCVGWVVAVIVTALLAPVLPLPDPTAVPATGAPFAAPSIHHLMGTDELGRDLFSRVVFGARDALLIGFCAAAFGLVLGGTLGLVAGYLQGVFDIVFNFVATVWLAFPALVLLLAGVTFLGPSVGVIVILLGLLSVAPIFRVTRGATMALVHREFVTAARGIGATTRRILWRDLLPNVVPILMSFGLLAVAGAILAEAGLAFLGLSVPPPTPTWGGIVSEGLGVLSRDVWIALWPSLALVSTLLALNFAGDRLRSRYDVRQINP